MLTNRVTVVRGVSHRETRPSALWTRIAQRAIQVAVCAGLLVLGGSREAAAQLYWNTNGSSATITASNWSTGTSGPFTTTWTSGTNIVFTANSSITGATTNIGNLTILNSSTVTWSNGNTLGTGGAVRTFDVGAGSVLNWSQQMSTSSGGGIIKSGSGTWNINRTMQNGGMPAGITLNLGTIVTDAGTSYILGSGTLTINGGTWQSSSSGTNGFNGLVIGGDFAVAGTGNLNMSGTGNVSLGSSTRTITNNTSSGSRQFKGVISGSAGAGLTFTGTGAAQFYLGNTGNTFSGPVTITGGETVVNDNGAFGSSTSITIDGGRLTMGTMDGSGNTTALTSGSIASSRNIFVGSGTGALSVQDATGNITYNGVIADRPTFTGVLAKQGGGTLVLGGSSTYSGATLINNGTIQLTGGNNRLPTTTVLSLGQSGTTNLGALDLNGNNQQIAGLASNAGSNLGVSKNTVTSAGAATLTINVASGTFSYGAGTAANSGIITGSVSVTKSGNGTQVLGDVNTYTGSTSINGGTLVANGGIASSAVTINNTGILGGSGTTGSVTVNSGATISPGNSPGTLTTGAMTFNGGGNYNWQLYNSNGVAGTGWDFISGTGALTINATSGSPFNVNLWTLSGTNPDVNGNALNFNSAIDKTWTIGTFTGGISGTSNGWYTINTGSFNGTSGFANSFTGGTFSLATSGNNLNLIYTAPLLTTYDYIAGTGNWSTGSNWTGGTAPSGSGLAITFSGAGGTSTNDSQLSSVTGIMFTGSTSGSYVVAGSALSIGGAGVVNNSSSAQTIQNVLTATAATVVNANAGNLTLSGTFDNAGFGVTLQGGNAISLATVSGTGSLSKIDGGTATLNGSVATNSVSVSGGSLALGASDLLSNTAAVTLSGSGTPNLGGFTDTVGSLSMSANTTLANGTLTAGTYALGGGTVSGNLGGGTLTNTGNTSLTGTAAAGTVNLNAGTLTLGSAGRLTGTPVVTGSSGATLALGGNETIASLAGGAAVTLGSATLTVGSDNTSTTYSGVISGSGGLTKNGTGTLTLSGNNTFTGPTVINAGAIGISNASSRTFSSSVSGSGGLVKTGAGTLTLSGSNTYSGGTTISDGTVSVAAASNLTTSGSIGVTGNGALRFNGSDTFGGVGQQLVLSATQSANPIINLASGFTATFLGDVVLASGTNRIEPTGGSAFLTLAGNVTGAGTLQKAATGTLILSGTGNTFSGGIIIGNGKVTVSAGSGLGSGPVVLNPTANGAPGNVTLELNESVSIGSLSTSTSGGGSGGRFITIASGKTLGVNQTTNATFSGDISGAGGLTKTGAAALTLTGSNSFSGPTTVSDGSITYSGAKTFTTSGTVTVTNGGGIVLDSNGTYGGLGQALVLSATQSGAPVLSITSGNTPTFQGDVNLASGVNRIEANGSTGVLTLSGNVSGAGTFLKQASGELVLAGSANTATGATQVGNGKITVNAGSALGTGDLSFVQTGVNNTRVDLKNAAQTIGNLSTVWSATAQPSPTTITQRLDLAAGTTLTVNQTSATTFGDYAGAPANVTGSGVITGDGSIVKAGAGVLTLTGSNTYGGSTSVNAGGLLVNGVNAGVGLVSVGNAAWIGGSGSLAGGLSLASGALFVFDPLTSFNVSGVVTLDNSFSVASLVSANGSAFNWGSVSEGTYTLINTTSTFNNIQNFGAANAASIGSGRSAYFQNGSLQLVVVPEPSAIALAGLGVALAGYAAWKRRRAV
jgi:autotransporter-associated beta strand protein